MRPHSSCYRRRRLDDHGAYRCPDGLAHCRTLDGQQIVDRRIDLRERLEVALPLGDDQVGLAESLPEGGRGLVKDRSRRIRAVVDHLGHLVQPRHDGILMRDVVEHRHAAHNQSHAAPRQRLDQQLVEDDLAGVVRQIEDPLRRLRRAEERRHVAHKRQFPDTGEVLGQLLGHQTLPRTGVEQVARDRQPYRRLVRIGSLRCGGGQRRQQLEGRVVHACLEFPVGIGLAAEFAHATLHQLRNPHRRDLPIRIGNLTQQQPHQFLAPRRIGHAHLGRFGRLPCQTGDACKSCNHDVVLNNGALANPLAAWAFRP
jgi:hypothetical protein